MIATIVESDRGNKIPESNKKAHVERWVISIFTFTARFMQGAPFWEFIDTIHR